MISRKRQRMVTRAEATKAAARKNDLAGEAADLVAFESAGERLEGAATSPLSGSSRIEGSAATIGSSARLARLEGALGATHGTDGAMTDAKAERGPGARAARKARMRRAARAKAARDALEVGAAEGPEAADDVDVVTGRAQALGGQLADLAGDGAVVAADDAARLAFWGGRKAATRVGAEAAARGASKAAASARAAATVADLGAKAAPRGLAQRVVDAAAQRAAQAPTRTQRVRKASESTTRALGSANVAAASAGRVDLVAPSLRTAATRAFAGGMRKAGATVAAIGRQALGAIASAAPVIVPIMLAAAVLVGILGGISTISGQQRTSGGARIAAVAEAEYSSGLAAGDYHQGGAKYRARVGVESDWCAIFVTWCASQCGYLETGIIPDSRCADFDWYASNDPRYGTYGTIDATYSPRQGDLVMYYDSDDNKLGGASHVEMVTTVEDDGSFYVVGGNTSTPVGGGGWSSNGVNRKYHHRAADGSYPSTNWGQTAMYARPNYPSVATGVGSLTGVKAQIARYLLDVCGYDKVHVAAIMGNMYAESNYQADVTEYGYSREACLDPSNGNCGFGLCGWTATVHKAALYALAAQRGGSVLDVDIQLEHLANYLSSGYADFFAADNVEDATYRFLMDFERPADPSASLAKRTSEAKSVYEALNSAADAGRYAAVLEAANSQLGVPYSYSWDCVPNVEMDCSSIVWYAFTTAGYSIPRCQNYLHGGTDSMAYWVWSSGSYKTSLSDLEVGDVMLFGSDWFSTGHVALYIGDGKMIHSIPDGGVQVSSVWGWAGSFLGAGQLI